VYVLCVHRSNSADLKHSSGRKGRLTPVLDDEALSRLVKEVVRTRFKGNQSEAARAVGLHPSRLSRIVRKQTPGLRPRTLAALERLLPRQHHRALHESLLDEATEDILTLARRWRIWTHTTRHLTVRSSPNPVETAAASRARERARVRRFAALRMIWEEHYVAQCNALRSEAERHAQTTERLEWAWERMLEPLVDSADTAYIERCWEELPERDRQRFVEASISQELVLLRRVPDLQRAHLVQSARWRRRRAQRQGPEMKWATERRRDI
jgi:hypothetical protein